jgi:hypothetical protein
VYLRAGQDAVSPRTVKEERTLGLVSTATPDSRLACQCRVQGEGVVVEVPAGLYVQSLDGLDKLIGDRAGYDYLHPVTGRTLIPKGKIITRTVFQEFATAAKELAAVRDSA